jgi:hypothetical protein
MKSIVSLAWGRRAGSGCGSTTWAGSSNGSGELPDQLRQHPFRQGFDGEMAKPPTRGRSSASARAETMRVRGQARIGNVEELAAAALAQAGELRER